MSVLPQLHRIGFSLRNAQMQARLAESRATGLRYNSNFPQVPSGTPLQ